LRGLRCREVGFWFGGFGKVVIWFVLALEQATWLFESGRYADCKDKKVVAYDQS
jgi:hypothetical protein